MNTLTVDKLINIAKSKDYSIFYSNGIYNCNLNIWGIRSNNPDTEHFNDMFVLFYQTIKGKWNIETFEGTTDPSDNLLRRPANVNGCAILVPGQHRKMWSYGFHKGRRDHKALVQFSPVPVYRDRNLDNILDFQSPIETGMFGINMHRASAYGDNPEIGLYSAGCQVHAHIAKYNNTFIPLIETCVREGNSIFSYTLITENDLL